MNAIGASHAPPVAPTTLPIDAVLPDLISALTRERRVVLEAPPGAGKTTRVPPAIAQALGGVGEVWVLEPRRLAARTAARRVAEERGEEVGRSVGYRVRFDDRTSTATRIVYATEGVLLERLRHDPSLAGIAAVVFDEFHERHLDGDVVLGLAQRLAERRELWLCVMSATLDAAPIATHLQAPRVTSEGRRFPVEVRYAPLGRDEALERAVAVAARACLVDGDGDVLVFLPGAREIRAAERVLGERAAQENIDVVPLHGDLPPEAQDRAIRRGPRRKIILSTNVAETSVTIEGVTSVVDSGLARVASHSPWTGLPTLAVRRISRASAAQRAGRAGRTAPGRCVRLYSAHDHDTRAEHELPEIARADLSSVVLMFAAQHIAFDTFSWLTAPPLVATQASRALLERLGAIDEAGAITSLGRQMVSLPLHPRAARLLVEAERRGARAGGALMAATVGNSVMQVRSPGQHVDGPADLLEEMERIRAVTGRGRVDFDRARREGLDPGGLAELDRLQARLMQILSRQDRKPVAQLAPGSVPEEQALLRSLLAAFPDRVAKRRRPRGEELVFCEGGNGSLSRDSVVRSAELLIAYDVTERTGQAAVAGNRGRELDGVLVRGASRVECDWLLEDFVDRIDDVTEYEWNAEGGRVEELRRLRYGAIIIDESRSPARPDGNRDRDAAIAGVLGAALAEAMKQGGGKLAELRDDLGRVLDRLAFMAQALPELGLVPPPAIGDDSVAARTTLREMFASACVGCSRFDELASVSARSLAVASLTPEVGARLDRDAPEFISLPARGRVLVEYPRGQPPFVASRLQDFFGLSQGPSLAGGRVPLTLHLLAPNKRAVQITQDLAGFWERHYPALRRELGRRYPRHKWPEDPLQPESGGVIR